MPPLLPSENDASWDGNFPALFGGVIWLRMLRFWLASLKAWNSLTATGRPFSFSPVADRGCKHSAPLAVACPPPGHAPSNVCSQHHNDDTETGKSACPRLHAARCHMDPVCLAKFREREMVGLWFHVQTYFSATFDIVRMAATWIWTFEFPLVNAWRFFPFPKLRSGAPAIHWICSAENKAEEEQDDDDHKNKKNKNKNKNNNNNNNNNNSSNLPYPLGEGPNRPFRWTVHVARSKSGRRNLPHFWPRHPWRGSTGHEGRVQKCPHPALWSPAGTKPAKLEAPLPGNQKRYWKKPWQVCVKEHPVKVASLVAAFKVWSTQALWLPWHIKQKTNVNFKTSTLPMFRWRNKSRSTYIYLYIVTLFTKCCVSFFL